jgi:hypothetical protein
MTYTILLIFSLLTSNIILLLGVYLFFKQGKSINSMSLFGFGFAGILVSVGLLYKFYTDMSI